jgi:hypothetical protein
MAQYSSLPPSKTVHGVTGSCHIVVRNRSQSVLRLLWLNFQGSPQEYAQIQPNNNYVCNTYTTHTWVIEDPDGNMWAHYQGTLPVLGKFRERVTIPCPAASNLLF